MNLKLLKTLYLLLFFVAGYSQATPNLYWFHHLNQQNGLSQGDNAFVSRDSYGYTWLSSADGLNRYDGKNIKIYSAKALSHSDVSSYCFEAKNGDLWLTTYNAINHYIRAEDRFEQFYLKENGSNTLLTEDYYAFYLDKDDDLWIRQGTGTSGKLYKYNINTHEQTELGNLDGYRVKVHLDENEKPKFIVSTLLDGQPGLTISYYGENSVMSKDTLIPLGENSRPLTTFNTWIENDTTLWVGTTEGLALLHLGSTPQWSGLYKRFQGKSTGRIWDLVAYDKDYLIASTGNVGLLFFDKRRGEFVQQYQNSTMNPHSLMSNELNELFLDHENNLWISSYGKGVDFCNLSKTKFYLSFQSTWKDSSIGIISIANTRENTWLGTTKNKILVLDSTQVLVDSMELEGGRQGVFLHVTDEEDIWAYSGRLLWLKEQGNKDFRLRLTFEHEIKYLYVLKDGQILVSTLNGFYEVSKKGAVYTKSLLKGLESYHDQPATFIFEDVAGRIYLSMNASSLLVLEKTQEGIKIIEKIPEVGFVFGSHEELNESEIWLTTSLGLARLNTDSLNVEFLEDASGSQSFYGILADSSDLWLSGNKGLYVFSKKKGVLRAYSEVDGLQSLEFSSTAYAKSNDNTFFFGGINGLNYFRPDQLVDIPTLPKVQLLRLKVSEKDYVSPDSTPLYALDFMNLGPTKNTLEFEFIGMEFSDPSKIRYRYMMDGIDDIWLEAGNRTNFRYPKLSPGNYTFKLKAINPDGVESLPHTIRIQIRPWIYQRIWFKGLMLLLAGILVWLIYRDQLKRRLKTAEIKNLEELDRFKSRFFTSITHEFRTPLSIIKGNIDSAIGQGKQIDGAKLQTVQTHTNQLMDLINQILDLRKVRAAKIKLQYTHSDVVDFCQKIVDGFSSLAAAKNIQLTFTTQESNYPTYLDEDKLHTILRNLLSNAIKFTGDGGKVELALEMNEEHLTYRLTDNGLGIPAEKLPRVFEQFYQAHEKNSAQVGSGVGLALSKELANALKGDITVESQVGEGSVFTLRLPKHVTVPMEMALEEAASLQLSTEDKAAEFPQGDLATDNNLAATLLEEAQEGQVGKPVILVVEDNMAFQQFIRDILAPHFRLEMSNNGAEGFAKANTLIPDVIISDVKMPIMDGFEMTKKLKDNYSTSHIPVILLTGLDDLNSRLSGIAGGADVYLNKPFNEEELLLWIHNLLNLRERLQEVYSNLTPAKSEENAEDLDPHSSDAAFVKKVLRIIEENYHDEHFTVTRLAELMEMDYMTIYRKFGALRKNNISTEIQHVRIRKAKLLLWADTKKRIKSIAYEVGYADPKYFSRIFKEIIGVTPKVYRDSKKS